MTWRALWRLSCVWLTCCLWATGSVATTRWVTKTATGSGNGTDSLTNAWTMDQANANVAVGETVRVLNGSYGSGPGVASGTCLRSDNGADCYTCNRITWIGNITNPQLVVVPSIPAIGLTKQASSSPFAEGATSFALSTTHTDIRTGCRVQAYRAMSDAPAGRTIFPAGTEVQSKAGSFTITVTQPSDTSDASTGGAEVSLAAKCVTVRGFMVAGGLTFTGAAFRDSLSELIVNGGLAFNGADRCILSNSIVNPGNANVQFSVQPSSPNGTLMLFEDTSTDTLANVTAWFNVGSGSALTFYTHTATLGDTCGAPVPNQAICGGSVATWATGNSTRKVMPASTYLGEAFADSLAILNSALSLASSASEPATPAVELYGCRRCKFQDTQFVITANQVKDWAWAFRDSVTGCTFNRVTWKIQGTTPGAFMAMTPGSSLIFGALSCDGNMYTRCNWLRTGPGSIVAGDPTPGNSYGSALVNHRDDMLTETYDYCVMATNFGTAFSVGNARGVGDSRLNHCTLVSPSTYGTISIAPTANWSKQLLLENNIYYRIGGTPDVTGSAVRWTVTPPSSKSSFNSNGNLYADYSSSNTPARSINNAGTITSLASWVTSSSKDSNSVYGSPQFVDSSAVNILSFTGDIKTTSSGHNLSLDLTDIGARQILTDGLRPAAITDFRVLSMSNSTVTLGWTSPGDDHFPGVTHADTAIGTPAFYTLKKWPNGINFATWLGPDNMGGSGSIWSHADSIVAHTPSAAGVTDSITVANLSSSQYYSFILQAHDEAGHVNEGDYSNSIIVLTNNANNDDGSGGTTPGGGRDKEGNGYLWPQDAWHLDLAMRGAKPWQN